MIASAPVLEPSGNLVAENAEILKGFEAQGAAIDQVTHIEFMCDFRQPADAKTCLQRLQTLGQRADVDLPDLVASEFWEDPCERPFMMGVTFALPADALAISRVEQIISALARDLDGGDVSWEFLRPGT